MEEFKLSDVGEGMHEAEIIRWLVKPGEMVRLDQPLVEIQTDKSLVELPSPVSGKVVEIKFDTGQIARVGDILVVLDPAGAKTQTFTPAAAGAASPSQKTPLVTATDTEVTPKPATGTARPVRAAPAVRKYALEKGVDLVQVRPSSPDGRVLLEDIKAYVLTSQNNPPGEISRTNGSGSSVLDSSAGMEAVTEAVSLETNPYDKIAPLESAPRRPVPVIQTAQSGPEVEEERKALLGLRRRIAERMEQSWRTIPHVTSFDELDATNLIALRASLKAEAEKRGVHLTYLPIIVKAVINTLKRFPIFNSSLDEKSREIVYKHRYHIGIATSTPDGLLVPVLRDANHKTMLQLAAEIIRLGEGGRQRSLPPAELSGSTFTITNFGSYGEAVGTPIINYPEAAILGIGRIGEKAVVRAGQIVALPIMPFCLSFDHRLIDGADSGAFMVYLKNILEHPSLLLLEG